MNTIILNRLIQYICGNVRYPKEIEEIVSNLPEEFLKSFDFDYMVDIVESKTYSMDLKDAYPTIIAAIIELYIENKLTQEVWPNIFENKILDYISLEINFGEKIIYIDLTGWIQSEKDKEYISLAYNWIIDICKDLGFNTLSIEKDIFTNIEDDESEDLTDHEQSSEIIHLK